nr:MAG TPA: hypothetical protein [Caudoviricetes sp.]
MNQKVQFIHGLPPFRKLICCASPAIQPLQNY